MSDTFKPGFRAAAFGIRTREQMLIFCIMMTVVCALAIVIVSYVMNDWLGRTTVVLMLWGLFLVIVWARLRALGNHEDTGDLVFGAILVFASLLTGIVRMIRRRKNR